MTDRTNGTGPLRVLLVAPHPPPYGGMGRWTAGVRQLAAGRTGLDVTLVDTSPRWRGIDDLAIWKRVVGGGLQLVRDYIQILRRLLRRPDVMHIATSGQLATVRDLLVIATARAFRVPCVYNLHFGRLPRLAETRRPEWYALAWAMRWSRRVVVIDQTSRRAVVRRLPRQSVDYVPNGLDLTSLPDPGLSGRGERTVVFVGWILPAKGVPELLEAWRAIASTSWTLEIIGPGRSDYRTSLEQQYGAGRIVFRGELPHAEAMKRMSEASLFVLPSHTEGFPYVILEAMALGRAIVATSVGAIPQMLSAGCGLLVPPRDARALARTLRRAMEDGSLRISMGENAHRRILSEYTLATMFEQYLQIWRQVAERGGETCAS